MTLFDPIIQIERDRCESNVSILGYVPRIQDPVRQGGEGAERPAPAPSPVSRSSTRLGLEECFR